MNTGRGGQIQKHHLRESTTEGNHRKLNDSPEEAKREMFTKFMRLPNSQIMTSESFFLMFLVRVLAIQVNYLFT